MLNRSFSQFTFVFVVDSRSINLSAPSPPLMRLVSALHSDLSTIYSYPPSVCYSSAYSKRSATTLLCAKRDLLNAKLKTLTHGAWGVPSPQCVGLE
jgi:hypothetical protein